MPVLGNRASFWVIASVVALTMWSSGGPSMIYPLYISEWHLAPVVVTSIFAVYAIALALTLVGVGGISDYIGRKPVLIAGSAVMALGLLSFAVGPDVSWFYAGRVLQGIGSGLVLSTATAAMVDFAPGSSAGRASSANSTAVTIGLASSTIVGGALVEYGPAPLRLSFWLLFGLNAAFCLVLLLLPQGDPGLRASGRWRPKGITVPKGLGAVVIVACFALASAWAMGGLTMALGAQIARDLVSTENAFIAGVIISLYAIASSVVSALSRRLDPRLSVCIGGVVALTGMALLLITSLSHSLLFFLLACVVSGLGNGLFLFGGLGLVGRYAPLHHRAQTNSVAYLVAYFVNALIGILLGVSVTVSGLGAAVDIWALVIGAFCLLTGAVALTLRMPRGEVMAP